MAPTAAPTAAPPAPTKTAASKPVATPAVKPAATPAATPVASTFASAEAGGLPGQSSEGLPGGGLVTDDTPTEGGLVPGFFWPLMVGGFGTIGLVIAFSAFAMKRDRHRQVLAEEAALAARTSAAQSRTAAVPERMPAMWERDAALEEAPIGTVEYLPLEDGRAVGSPPEDLPEPEGPRRVNPRLARINDARNSRQLPDRRSLLRRS